MTTTSLPGARQPVRRVPPPALRRLRRVLRQARRPLAAVLLAVATAVVVHAGLRPGSSAEGPGVEVVVAARDLPTGADLAEGTTTSRLPQATVPQGALGPADLTARPDAHLAAPVRRGEVLTDVRLGGSDVRASLRPGQVAVPVSVASPLPTGLVGPGDTVTVFDAGLDGGTLVPSATVLGVSSGATTTGLLSGGLGSGAGAPVVVLALEEDDAARVAAASSSSGVVLGLAP